MLPCTYTHWLTGALHHDKPNNLRPHAHDTRYLLCADQYEDNHAFSEFANWVVPGYIMLGRYPFVEPSRCSSRDKGEKQLQRILEAGIQTFVCLQGELPPQKDMLMKGVDGFLPYKSTAELIKRSLNPPPPSEIVDGLRNPTLDKYLPPRRRKAVNVSPCSGAPTLLGRPMTHEYN